MTAEKFSPEQSLQVIQSMIDKTKKDLAGNSFYFLLWGWLVFIATLLHFGLMKFTNAEHPEIAWCLMLIGVIASIVNGIREAQKERVKTYVGETMKYFGMSLGLIYMTLAFIFGTYNLWVYSFPVYILIYAVACFFMGSIMQFSFLKWAGLCSLTVVVASVYVGYEWQLLLLALVVLVAYIIPGHILRAKEKLQNS